MPEPTTLTVHYNRKIQLERYEPVEHGASLEIQLEEDDDWQEVYDEYAEVVEREVEDELMWRVTKAELGDGPE